MEKIHIDGACRAERNPLYIWSRFPPWRRRQIYSGDDAVRPGSALARRRPRLAGWAGTRGRWADACLQLHREVALLGLGQQAEGEDHLG